MTQKQAMLRALNRLEISPMASIKMDQFLGSKTGFSMEKIIISIIMEKL
ncbi:hypothetical protein [uncultured Anaerococcus sp.]|nr:hypothetical protein [uncultured Anaerococcus sp.]